MWYISLSWKPSLDCFDVLRSISWLQNIPGCQSWQRRGRYPNITISIFINQYRKVTSAKTDLEVQKAWFGTTRFSMPIGIKNRTNTVDGWETHQMLLTFLYQRFFSEIQPLVNLSWREKTLIINRIPDEFHFLFSVLSLYKECFRWRSSRFHSVEVSVDLLRRLFSVETVCLYRS